VSATATTAGQRCLAASALSPELDSETTGRARTPAKPSRRRADTQSHKAPHDHGLDGLLTSAMPRR